MERRPGDRVARHDEVDAGRDRDGEASNSKVQHFWTVLSADFKQWQTVETHRHQAAFDQAQVDVEDNGRHTLWAAHLWQYD